MKVRVEYVWDDEAQNWGFAVPALHIVGGGDPTREAAAEHAADVARFALEGVESDFDTDLNIEVGYLDVDVRPAQPVSTAKAG